MKVILEVDSSKFILEVESLTIFLIETSFSFLLYNIPLDKTFSFDVEFYEDRLTTEIVLSNEITRVDLSSHEFVDEVAINTSRFELTHSSFWIFFKIVNFPSLDLRIESSFWF